jgi:basic amino acid/polyamine antiporter, APA family
MDFKSLLRTKSLQQVLENPETDPHGNSGELVKKLKLWDLVSLGIAAVIGAGIFSTIGKAAFEGGPGIIFLFIITAITCGFTAMCYAEFAARVPVAGSAYTYSYVTFGELVAWIIGWALILEYAIGNIVVAISWSSYFNNLLEGLHIHLPKWMITDSYTAKALYDTAVSKAQNTEGSAWATAPMLGDWHIIFNLPAFIIVILVTWLVYLGIQESKKGANFMVGLKLVVLFVVIVVGFFYVKPAENWADFMPKGWSGVLGGVSAVFYAYIGFDAISTVAEECENPQRDMPRGMIYALIICTIIYILTALVITGMVKYSEFQGVADPLAYVFEKTGLTFLNYAISVSAVVATTSVLLVFQLGQPRIWMSMSRDGLMPKSFSKIHPKYGTPSFATIVTGFLVAIPALFMDANLMTDLTSIGTLFAFVLVCAGVLLLPTDTVANGVGINKRFKLPYINGQYIVPILFTGFIVLFREKIGQGIPNIFDATAPYFKQSALNDFKDTVPTAEELQTATTLIYHRTILFALFLIFSSTIVVKTFLKKWSLIPILGVLFCSYLLIEIPVKSWFVFFGWMALGLTIYFSYGHKKSKLA